MRPRRPQERTEEGKDAGRGWIWRLKRRGVKRGAPEGGNQRGCKELLLGAAIRESSGRWVLGVPAPPTRLPSLLPSHRSLQVLVSFPPAPRAPSRSGPDPPSLLEAGPGRPPQGSQLAGWEVRSGLEWQEVGFLIRRVGREFIIIDHRLGSQSLKCTVLFSPCPERDLLARVGIPCSRSQGRFHLPATRSEFITMSGTTEGCSRVFRPCASPSHIFTSLGCAFLMRNGRGGEKGFWGRTLGPGWYAAWEQHGTEGVLGSLLHQALGTGVSEKCMVCPQRRSGGIAGRHQHSQPGVLGSSSPFCLSSSSTCLSSPQVDPSVPRWRCPGGMTRC